MEPTGDRSARKVGEGVVTKREACALGLAIHLIWAGPALAQPEQTKSTAEPDAVTTTEVQMSQEDDRASRQRRAGEIIREMLPPEAVKAMEETAPTTRFGGEFARLAYESAYVALWARPGLTLKERSLLTIGILIGAGKQRELESHFRAGMRNGITRQELEEIIYHSTAYAGFPAASEALAVAAKVAEER